MLFPIRCGKDLGGGEYQLPVLVLCCDVGPAPRGGAERLVLTWRDLRMLLHEMGHALHNLCSRTTYQHLWGTRWVYGAPER
jgi:mitochondrial intermediate peptidase